MAYVVTPVVDIDNRLVTLEGFGGYLRSMMVLILRLLGFGCCGARYTEYRALYTIQLSLDMLDIC